LLQHRFDVDRRRGRVLYGENVFAAAPAYRVADDVLAVQGIKPLVPDLVEHAQLGPICISLGQSRQLLS
jgi:hypothetical protein